MIRLGKTYGNLMVDLRAWNDKLVDRSPAHHHGDHRASTERGGRDHHAGGRPGEARPSSWPAAACRGRRRIVSSPSIRAGSAVIVGDPPPVRARMTERPVARRRPHVRHIHGRDGRGGRAAHRPHPRRSAGRSSPARTRTRSAASSRPRSPAAPPGSSPRLHARLGEWAAEAVDAALAAAQTRASDLAFIAFPGHTVWHEPPTVTWQLGEAAVLAERFGVRVVSNFRARDVAAGGQGAPLVPIADVLLFGAPDAPAGAAQHRRHGQLHLRRPPGRRRGRARARHRARHGGDRRGRAAGGAGQPTSTGTAPSPHRGGSTRRSLAELLADPFFAAPPPRQHGARALRRRATPAALHERVPGPDGVATAVELTARSIADALRDWVPGHARGGGFRAAARTTRGSCARSARRSGTKRRQSAPPLRRALLFGRRQGGGRVRAARLPHHPRPARQPRRRHRGARSARARHRLPRHERAATSAGSSCPRSGGGIRRRLRARAPGHQRGARAGRRRVHHLRRPGVHGAGARHRPRAARRAAAPHRVRSRARRGPAVRGTHRAARRRPRSPRSGDLDLVRWAGAVTGSEARSIGVNWVFAPVADLDLLPENPIVQSRAFGDDPAAVARVRARVGRGLRARSTRSRASSIGPGMGAPPPTRMPGFRSSARRPTSSARTDLASVRRRHRGRGATR